MKKINTASHQLFMTRANEMELLGQYHIFC